MAPLIVRITIFLCLAALVPSTILSQELPSLDPLTKFWSPDYNVETTALSADRRTIYLGGSFRFLRSDLSGAFAFNTSTSATPIQMPIIQGDVHAAISDGSGGWYLGGNFTLVGDTPRSGLAHITAGGAVRSNFSPYVSIGTVYSLALHGSVLYIGGDFTSVNGEERLRLAAVSTDTGALLPWNPSISANSESPAATIYSMVIDPDGGSLYIGGRLTSVSGVARRGIARFDLPSGQLSNWAPTLGPSYEPGVVFTLAFDPNQEAIFAGGYFRAVNDVQTSYHLTALRASDGEKLPAWTAGIVGTVYAIALDPHTQQLYLGGSLSSVGGQARTALAAVHAASGALSSWDPVVTGVTGSVSVRTLQLDPERDTLYLGGGLSSVNGETRTRVAAVSTAHGIVSPWAVPMGLNLTGTQRMVTTLALSADGTTILAGGQNLILEHRRNRLAALDVETGQVTSWNPDLRGGLVDDPNRPDLARVDRIALHHASGKLYIAATGVRYFAGQDLGFRRLFSIDLTTGTSDAWNPQISNQYGEASSIRALMVDQAANLLYVGGSFANVDGQARNSLVRFRLSDGSLDSWNPAVTGSVSALELDGSTNTLYVGGLLGYVGTLPRKRLAAISTLTAEPYSWRPNLTHPGDSTTGGALHGTAVVSLHLDRQRQSLFVGIGGSYGWLHVASQMRHGLAEISTVNDEMVYPGNPLSGFSSPFPYSMVRDPETDSLYIAGLFYSTSGDIADRRSLLSLDLSTRLLTSWQPIGTGDSVGTYGNLYGRSLEIDPVRGVLYAAGTFSSFSGIPKSNFAAFQLREPPESCPADFDGDGQLSTADLFTFLAAFFARDMRADFDGSGTVATPDIFAFLNIWFEGC